MDRQMEHNNTLTSFGGAMRPPMVEMRQAQIDWAAIPVAKRVQVIRALRHRIADEAKLLVDSLATVPGRQPAESLAAEIIPLAEACRFLEREAARLLAPRRVGRRGRPAWLPGVTAEVRREPFGIVLVIGPSNYPLLLPGVQLLQALAAGNAVLVKPAPGYAAPVAALAGWLEDAGLPNRLLQLLGDRPEDATTAIAAGVDKLVLTGSAETGRRLMAALKRQIVPATMELSGNDAVFVLPGANLDLVSRALQFGLRLNGSATCIAPRRVFISRRDAFALEQKLAEALRVALPVPVSEGARRKVKRLLDDAIGSGARLVGTTPDPGEATMTPLVVADVRPGMELLHEEFFAPVLSLVPVADEEEALAVCAQSPFALGASIFGLESAARRLACRVDAGSVTINDLIVPTADPRLPFGGRHNSGWGVTRGAEGLLEMTRVKTVSVRRGRLYVHFDPLGRGDEALMQAALRAIHGRGAVRRSAVLALLRALRDRVQWPVK